ncbi:MAG: hypothetical protein IJ071_07280 [Ruminococcus sp.]|nr:hypothetical protein [Ruminococcus sp.]
MKRLTILLAAALLLTGCGDYDSSPGAEAESSSEEVTEEVTEEETEPETEELTDAPTAYIDDEGSIVIDGKKYKDGSSELQEKVDNMMESMASYLDLEPYKVPEEYRTVPEDWQRVSHYGMSISCPADSVQEDNGFGVVYTSQSCGSVTMLDDPDAEPEDSDLAELTEEYLEREKEKKARAFEALGLGYDGSDRSYMRNYLLLTREEVDALEDEELRDTIYGMGAGFMFYDRVFMIPREEYDVYIMRFGEKYLEEGQVGFMIDLLTDDKEYTALAAGGDLETAMRIASSITLD